MSTIHSRLRDERERLGLTQDKFAIIGGVRRRAQVRYESGETCPDGHYFAAIAGVGADVLYILTGVQKASASTPGESVQYARWQSQDVGSGVMEGMSRVGGVSRGVRLVDLTDRESALIGLVRGCGQDDQDLILRLAVRLSVSESGYDNIEK